MAPKEHVIMNPTYCFQIESRLAYEKVNRRLSAKLKFIDKKIAIAIASSMRTDAANKMVKITILTIEPMPPTVKNCIKWDQVPNLYMNNRLMCCK